MNNNIIMDEPIPPELLPSIIESESPRTGPIISNNAIELKQLDYYAPVLNPISITNSATDEKVTPSILREPSFQLMPQDDELMRELPDSDNKQTSSVLSTSLVASLFNPPTSRSSVSVHRNSK